MSFQSRLQNLRSALAPSLGQRQQRRRGSLRAATHRLNLEALEERCLLSFNPTVSYPVGPDPQAVVAADFNHDTVLDLAVPTVFRTDGHPTSVAAADVNGDNVVDLVTATNSGTVSVLLGDGRGGFGAFHNYASGSWGQSVAVGDFNHDNMLDIVTSGNQYAAGGNTGHVLVLLGHGDGTFDIPSSQSLKFGVLASGVAVGDFNGDGLPDVSVTSTNDYGIGNANVLINAGNIVSPATLAISDVTVTEGNTGTALAVFKVTRGDNLDGTVNVNYSTANGGALAGSDYVAKSGTVTFAPGETSKTITVLVNGDRLPEPNETFFVNLSNPDNATIADGQGVGTILDNEPRISISDVIKAEGRNGHTTQFTFTVTLSAAYDQAVTMSFGTGDGTAKTSDSDYVAKTGTLTFKPGETTKTITVVVNGDSKKEADEIFFVDLFGNSSNSLFTKNRGTGTIRNDD